ncbi:cell wall hydrolase [Vulcanibacillus modesticaldus]|uniref:Cell wall hydrolase n=1 Tax=Vulcanibacillus modesticaldus TaxID=337097 RepID=A0A1D2YW08_9BACI|nr:cell wall hydrolase [Vulcanibacillus modesticaldus]OEF99871.1 cell wall hydrolase [Vulcanibacillus modesticaldus]
MAIIKTKPEHVQMLARLMRAEAEGEGKLGMLMVGNVAINRVIANCLDFKGIRDIPRMIYQSPGGFEAVQKSYFYQRPRSVEVRLAKQVLKGWKYHPASYSLWFFKPAGSCPPTWFNQPNSGRYKSHCFFKPYYKNCPQIFW